jgi:hypothetical protein
MLFEPAGGASVNTSLPAISAYESVFCLTPEIETITEGSFPCGYARLYSVVEPSPEKYSDWNDPETREFPRYEMLFLLQQFSTRSFCFFPL